MSQDVTDERLTRKELKEDLVAERHAMMMHVDLVVAARVGPLEERIKQFRNWGIVLVAINSLAALAGSRLSVSPAEALAFATRLVGV